MKRNHPSFRFLFALFSFLLLAFNAACTRTVKTSSVSISIPSDIGAKNNKVGALTATMQLGHLIVNVTGPGINPPIFYAWDSRDGKIVAPPTFNINVPTGDGRLVQVLAVYRESSTDANIFYYGDTILPISGDTSVTIPVAMLQTATGDGQIAGRYFGGSQAAPVYPTGPLVIRYTPTNKPPMVIERTEIIAGYFRAFGLLDVKLEYVLPGGELMFGKAVDLGSSDIVTSASVLKAYVPALYRQDGDFNSASFRHQDKSVVALGWFGPGMPSGRNVCYPNTTVTLNQAYSTASTANPVSWDKTVLASMTENFAHPLAGGANAAIESATGLCQMAGNRYASYFSLDAVNLPSHDSVTAFRGPYVANKESSGASQYRKVFQVSLSGSTFTFAWEYLPEVITNAAATPAPIMGVNGSDVFYRILSTTEAINLNEHDLWESDNMPCGALPGFNGIALQLPATAGATTVSQNASTGFPAELVTAYNQGRAVFALCPYTVDAGGAKRYFKTGDIFRNYSGGMGGGIMANAIVATFPSGPTTTTIYNNVCTPVVIKGINGTETNVDVPMNTNVALAGTAGASYFANKSDCDYSMNAISNIALFNSGAVVYVKMIATGAATGSLQFTPNNSLPALSRNINFVDQPGTLNMVTALMAPQNIQANRCYPLKAFSFHNSGTVPSPVLTLANFPSSYNFSSTAVPNVNFYYSPDCSYTSSSTLSFYLGGSYNPPNEYTTYFVYSANSGASTGATTSVNLNLSGDGIYSGAAGVTHAPTLTVQLPGPLNRVALRMPSQIEEGACTRVDFELQDASSVPVPLPVGDTLTLNPGANGQFYEYDSSCSSGGALTLSMSAGQSTRYAYYKNTSPSGTNVSVSATISSYTGTMSVTLQPPTAKQILVALPGQSYDNLSHGLVPYSIAQVPNNQPITLNLYAVKYNGDIDVSYNATLSYLSFAGVQSPPSPSAVTFVGGQATISSLAITPGATNFNVNLSAPGAMTALLNGYASVSLFSPATQFKLYMPGATTLRDSACQLFAVVPEDANGSAMIATPAVNVTFSTSAGGIYTDSGCTLPLAGNSYSAVQANDKIRILFFKPNSGASGTIQASAVGYSPATLNVQSTAGSVGPATKWWLLGFSGTTVAGRIIPYVAMLLDANDNFVVPGSSVTNMRPYTTYINGTTGAFSLDSTWQSPWLDGANQTLPSGTGYLIMYNQGPPNPGTQQRLDLYDMTTTYTTFPGLVLSNY